MRGLPPQSCRPALDADTTAPEVTGSTLVKLASVSTPTTTLGYQIVWPARTENHAGITSTPSSRTVSGGKKLYLTIGAGVISHTSRSRRLTLNRQRASLPSWMDRNSPELQRAKLLSRTDKQPGNTARLHLPQQPALLLFQFPLLHLPHLLNRLLSEEVARLNPCRRTKPGVPVDQTLFPHTEDRGESKAITLKGPTM